MTTAYISFAFVTYGFVWWNIRKSRIYFQKESPDVGGKVRYRKEHLVPMISTYIFLFIIPKLLEQFHAPGCDKPLVKTIFSILPKIGVLTDPIVYLLLTKHYHRNLQDFYVHVKRIAWRKVGFELSDTDGNSTAALLSSRVEKLQE